MFGALDDPSDKVFNVMIARLGKLPWAAVSMDVSTRLDRQWHDRSPARRQKMFELLAVWQQVAYLLRSLEREPDLQAGWLGEIACWCDRQAVIDIVSATCTLWERADSSHHRASSNPSVNLKARAG
jgi:hypothetical protein